LVAQNSPVFSSLEALEPESLFINVSLGGLMSF
jgi:hypothetical protein